MTWQFQYPKRLALVQASKLAVRKVARARSTAEKPHRRRRDWTLDERKLAFYLYCQLPFGRLDQRTPEVIALANMLGRTPSSIAMKLSNFASLDPAITESGRQGLRGASEGDRAVWKQFHEDWEQLAGECASLLQRRKSIGHEEDGEVVAEQADTELRSDYSSDNRAVTGEQRIGQDFFRRAVLSSYEGRCCMSGISDHRLLVASHIVPWKEDVRNRLNPRNGLCLSALHDRAFDRHMISLSADLRVMVSRGLTIRGKEPLIKAAFLELEGQPIALPRRFRPDADLLATHRDNFQRIESSAT